MNTQTNRRLFHAALILFMAVSVLLAAHPQAAQAQDSEFAGSRTFLIAIPQPDLWNSGLPAGLDRRSAARVARELLEKETGPILRELSRLEAQGVRLETTVLDDLSAIRVTLAEGDVAALAGALPEGISLADAGAEAPACASPAGVEALANGVWATSQALQLRAQHAPAEGETPAGALSQILVLTIPSYNFYSISGYAAPASEVQLRILRDGRQASVTLVQSDQDGFFSFSADELYCTNGELTWILLAGDVVEIRSAGMMTSLVYWPLTSSAYAEEDTISGSGPANRALELDIVTRDRNVPCGQKLFVKTVNTDAAGKFNVDVTGLVDFDRGAEILISMVDSAGNRQASISRVYQLIVYLNGDYDLILTPNAGFTLEVKRGDTIVESVTGTTSKYGSAYRTLSAAVQAGDQATVTFTGGQIHYTILDTPALTLDRSTGLLSGSGVPQGMEVLGRRDTVYGTPPRCSAQVCRSQKVSADGQVSMNFGPLINGEVINIDFFTPEGEHLADSATSAGTYLYLNLENKNLTLIGWPAGHYTLVLKDPSNAVKETLQTDKGVWNQSVYFTQPLLPGDLLEVSNDTTTRVMTVPELSAVRMNYNTDRITGSASAGHLLAILSAQTGDTCIEADQLTSGAFSLDPKLDILSQTHGVVSLGDGDGNYTFVPSRTFSFDTNIGQNPSASVVVEIAGATLNWELTRDSAVIDSGSATAPSLDNYIDFIFTQSPQAGDVLALSTSDGNSETLVFPELSVNYDPLQKLLSGKGPASSFVSVSIQLQAPGKSQQQDLVVLTDASGNWSARFDPGQNWTKCETLRLGNSCYSTAAKVTLANNFVIRVNNPPAAIAPDAYETDNTPELAAGYAGMQSHTLQAFDVDWVKFTVTADDVANATPFSLRTLNTGLNVGLTMELYSETNLMTPMASATGVFNGNGDLPPSILWTFTAPGTYFVMINSPGESGFCNSKYTLWILRDPQIIALPLIRR